MSTKITKGARLHLLRSVERLQYPMLRFVAPVASPNQCKALRDALDAMGRWIIGSAAGATNQDRAAMAIVGDESRYADMTGEDRGY